MSHRPLASSSIEHEAQRLLHGAMFIHVPKTGGTSVEQALQAIGAPQLAVRWQFQSCCDFARPNTRQCCFPGPPWHLAADVFKQRFNRSIEGDGSARRERWCIVRDPAARYASCVAWDRRVHPHPWDASDEASGLALATHALRGGRFQVRWGANGLVAHRQPQHWFVWDERGAVQCDCVVAFEKLPSFRLPHKNHGETADDDEPATPQALPASLQELYAPDVELWRRAKEAPGLCYRPRPRGGSASRPPPPRPEKSSLQVVLLGSLFAVVLIGAIALLHVLASRWRSLGKPPNTDQLALVEVGAPRPERIGTENIAFVDAATSGEVAVSEAVTTNFSAGECLTRHHSLSLDRSPVCSRSPAERGALLGPGPLRGSHYPVVPKTRFATDAARSKCRGGDVP